MTIQRVQRTAHQLRIGDVLESEDPGKFWMVLGVRIGLTREEGAHVNVLATGKSSLRPFVHLTHGWSHRYWVLAGG